MTIDFFDIPYYKLNKRLLSFLGQWPLQTPRERRIFRSTTLLLAGSIFIPKMIKFFKYSGDLESMILCVPVLGVHIRGYARFSSLGINATKLRTLLNRIKRNWDRAGTDFDETILKRYAERGRILTVLYAWYIGSALGMYLSLPVIPAFLDIVSPLNQSRDRIYLYETEYFIDKDKNYVLLLVHACVAMPFPVTMIIAHDAFYAMLVHHVCGVFANLGARLESIGNEFTHNYSDTNKKSIKGVDEVYANIVACIKIHKEAMEFTSNVESSGFVAFFIVVAIDMLVMAITGFMTVTNLDRPGEALRHGVFAFGEVMHLGFVCWQGEMVMEHSQQIFGSAYNMNWVDISARAKKLVVVLMMRSTEPSKLTAGKIFILSMENYAAALKTSMSYFTLLLSMQ